MHEYPKWKYHPERAAVLVKSVEDEKSLDAVYFDSPAEYGVETSPGIRPDPQISKRKKQSGAK